MRFFIFFILYIDLFASFHHLQILDRQTLLPIQNAIVSNQNCSVVSNEEGQVSVENSHKNIYIKAYGYKQQSIEPSVSTVFMEPFKPKALYVSFWAAGSSKYMNRIFDLAKNTEINAVILDIKNEYGKLIYKTDVPLAKEIGAHNERTIRDIKAFIQKLKAHDLYVIGRVVVFKDETLAKTREAFALKDANKTIWRNKEGLAWVDPFQTQVHDYVAQIAADAASKGFDEINFDYVRFPLRKNLIYQKKLNQKNRVQAISDFLATANKALKPYNVYTSVDTYGYVCWNDNDTNIGHTIESLSRHADYIAPMLYPSGFGVGILGYKDPTDHPYEIINASINEALTKSDIPASRFRPWLQSFKDYGFDRKFFRSKEVSAQIKGAEHAACSGWMLWNPSSRFSSKGLQDIRLPYPTLPAFDTIEKQAYCFRKEDTKLIE
jgi:hypothetical protein